MTPSSRPRRWLTAPELAGVTATGHPLLTIGVRAVRWLVIHATALPLVALLAAVALAPVPTRWLLLAVSVGVAVELVATGHLYAAVEWHHARWKAARIRATWAATMAANHLAEQAHVPRLVRARAGRGRVTLTVRYANGQALDDWRRQLDSLAARWEATHLELAPAKAGRLTVTVGIRDMLDRPRPHPWDG